jgi:hypothetical protein
LPPGTQTVNLNNRKLSLLKPSLIAVAGKLQSTGGTLQLNQGAMINQGLFESHGPGNSVGGALVNEGTGQIQIRAAGPAPSDLTVNQGLVNHGLITLDSNGFPVPVTLDIENGILANGPIGQIISVAGPGPQNVIRSPIRNDGTITVNKELVIEEPQAAHSNLGLINVSGGDLNFMLSGPNATVANAGQIEIMPGRQVVVSGGPLQNGGIFNIAAGASASITATLTQHTGTTNCNGTLAAAQIDLLGGVLAGAGQVAGPFNNSSGTVSPGASPGLLTAADGYTQGADGVLHIELAGLIPVGEHDVLSVTGAAALDGVLSVELMEGFDPPLGTTFDILTVTSGTVAGEFALIEPRILANGRSVVPTYLPDRVRLTVGCAPSDGDCDGDIDADDHSLFSDCLAGPNQSPEPTPPTTPQQCLDAFDADADADIDLWDFSDFTSLFGGG